ncbi:glutamate racemase [Pelagibius sp.]|uniref:glutamate racemase n=1 Tax=Pelagibius sp. TaxID=1931238 RepID=UPI003BB2214C
MIGVFDSGHGGLTVLRQLTARMPQEHFVYFGDHAFAPYGRRDPEEVYRLTLEAVERLFQHGCRLVLLACNTASAVALRRMQQDWLPQNAPNHRVLGVFVPMVEALTAVSWRDGLPVPGQTQPDGLVAIFATERTVLSGAYPLEISLRAPQLRVVSQACKNLVAAIEGQAAADELQSMVSGYVGELMAASGGEKPDSAVLGCTHYPLVADCFAAALPEETRLLDQPLIVADSLADYLRRHKRFAAAQNAAGGVRFLTSGDPERVSTFASRFFGAAVTFHSVAELDLLQK